METRETEASAVRQSRAASAVAAGRFSWLSSGWLSLAAIFAVALAVRIVVSAQLSSTPLFRTPQLDSREYWGWAERIAAGTAGWPVPPAHGPGYPYFLAGLLALVDGSAAAVRLVQAVLGATTCVLIAALGRRIFGRAAGLVAGFALALYGPVVLADVSILSEGLLLFLLTCVLVLVPGEGGRIRASFAGLLLGTAAIVRPTALLFLPPLLLWIAWRGAWSRRALGTAALVAAACALPILPVAVANARATERPVLIQGHGGMNFAIGNSPGGTGLPTVRPGEAWDRLESEPIRAGAILPADQDRYFYRKTFREIAAAPMRWIALLAAKSLWALQAGEIRDTYSYEFFRGESPLLRVLPGFGILFPLCAAGIAVVLTGSRSRNRFRELAAGREPDRADRDPAAIPEHAVAPLAAEAALPVLWLATAFATCVGLVVAYRYRLPMVPPAALLAGAGVSALFRLRPNAASSSPPPSKRLRLAMTAATAAAAAALLCRLETHGPSLNLAEEWSATGTALNQERDPAGAIAAFDRALAIDPRYAPARVGRGVSLMNLGRLEQSERELDIAVGLEPGSRAAVVELAIALERQNRRPEAERRWRQALALDPQDLPTMKSLGENLLRQGRPADALPLLARVVERAPGPDSWASRLALARVFGALRRPGDGLEQAQQAARIAPEKQARAEASIAAAMLAVDAGNLPAAESALADAEASDANPRDASIGRAILYRARHELDRADRELRPLVRADPGFRPAVELFLQIARDRGGEREAIDFVRQASQHAS